MDYHAFDPGSTLGDLYDTLSRSEQRCIEGEYSAADLAALRARPVFDEEDTEGQQLALLACIRPEKLSGVFYSFLISNAEAQGQELTVGQGSCLRQLVDRSDVLLIAGSHTGPSSEAQQALLAFSHGVLSCVPELAAGPTPPSPGALDESVIWIFTTGGWVVAALAVADGVVYAGSDDSSLHALAADSGEPLWSFPTGGAIRSIPTVADGTVYFGSNDNHVYALDAVTGEELWRYDTGYRVQRSPVVGDGMAYFPACGEWDHTIHAVDAATGALVWEARHPYPIEPRWPYVPRRQGLCPGSRVRRPLRHGRRLG